MSSLQALAKLISGGVANIESECAAHGRTYPSLDDPYTLEGANMQTQYVSQAAPVIAAAYQLIATLTHPSTYLFNWATASHFSASLAVVNEGYVPDILREAGHKGLHANQIAAKNNMDPRKLERILRFLATRHIFTEASPAVFTNNRLSEAMCLNKSVTDIQTRPLDKLDKTNGLCAIIEYLGDHAMKSAAYLTDVMENPEISRSQEPNKAPHNIAYKTDLGLHAWLQQPENIMTSKRLQQGMRSIAGHVSEDPLSDGFEWGSLPAGTLIVDVGGGIGTVTMQIATRHDHLRHIIQDLPGVISQTREHWTLNMPGGLESGRVKLQEHNFFDEQPVREADIFVVRYVLHNWSDQYCMKILKRLRDAARPTTKLIVLDEIMEYMSRDTSSTHADLSGTSQPTAPSPLLPYPEAATGFGYSIDMVMLVCLNAQERTLEHFIELFRGAGWKLERVNRLPSPHPQQLICTPI